MVCYTRIETPTGEEKLNRIQSLPTRMEACRKVGWSVSMMNWRNPGNINNIQPYPELKSRMQ